MSKSAAKFKVGQSVRRYSHGLPCCYARVPFRVTKVVFQDGCFLYTIQRDGSTIPPLTGVPEGLIKSVNDFNKFDVPYHIYELHLSDGNNICVDVGSEEDWGNIQHCTPGDCQDWETAIGYGNDADGHVKIVSVTDMEDGSTWSGNNAVAAWYSDCVARFVDKYSE